MSSESHLRFRLIVVLVSGLAVFALPASARIARSRTSAASPPAQTEGVSSLHQPLHALVIGSGFEYQSDRADTEYGWPFLIEYNFSERLKLTLEPKLAEVLDDTADPRSVSGFGDLETTLDYEFIEERRYLPALSIGGKIRWPTADHLELGDPGRDYTVGLIASKALVFVNLDLNVLYNFLADREYGDTVEVSLASGWPLRENVDLIAELATVSPTSRLRSAGDTGRSETEALVGLAWQVTKHLKFEQGIVFKEQGIHEFVFAWEWSFRGD
jgi:hypothetical protein